MKISKMNQKIIGAVMILAGIVLLLLALLRGCGAQETERVFEFEVGQEAPEVEATEMEVQYISIPGFKGVTIPANTKSVSVHLYNPEENPCYFEMIITIDEGETELYKSKLLSPGQDLYTIELETGLAAGAYDAILQYNTYSMDGNFTPMNGAQVPFTLTVK